MVEPIAMVMRTGCWNSSDALNEDMKQNTRAVVELKMDDKRRR